MKKRNLNRTVALGILLSLACGREEPRVQSPTPSEIELAEPAALYYAQKLERFYKKKTTGDPYANNPKWLLSISTSVLHWTRIFGIDDKAETILCMIHCESWFDPDTHGAAGEWGLMQMNPTVESEVWEELRRKGFRRGPRQDPDWQVAMGVCEFSMKLRGARGDLSNAIRDYNGRGKGAERYRRKVEQIRREVFP